MIRCQMLWSWSLDKTPCYCDNSHETQLQQSTGRQNNIYTKLFLHNGSMHAGVHNNGGIQPHPGRWMFAMLALDGTSISALSRYRCVTFRSSIFSPSRLQWTHLWQLQLLFRPSVLRRIVYHGVESNDTYLRNSWGWYWPCGGAICRVGAN